MEHNSPDPIRRVREAFERASPGEAFDPTAAALATADASGVPSVRFVLVKRMSADGFVFYTNEGSQKAREIAGNPNAALAFHWPSIGVQIRVAGPVERASEAEADAYFATRPRGSQLGAWASEQSRPVADRARLEESFRRVQERFRGKDVPRPSGWLGYRIIPARIEIWASRDNRLHDRELYLKKNGNWQRERLQP